MTTIEIQNVIGEQAKILTSLRNEQRLERSARWSLEVLCVIYNVSSNSG